MHDVDSKISVLHLTSFPSFCSRVDNRINIYIFSIPLQCLKHKSLETYQEGATEIHFPRPPSCFIPSHTWRISLPQATKLASIQRALNLHKRDTRGTQGRTQEEMSRWKWICRKLFWYFFLVLENKTAKKWQEQPSRDSWLSINVRKQQQNTLINIFYQLRYNDAYVRVTAYISKFNEFYWN